MSTGRPRWRGLRGNRLHLVAATGNSKNAAHHTCHKLHRQLIAEAGWAGRRHWRCLRLLIFFSFFFLSPPPSKGGRAHLFFGTQLLFSSPPILPSSSSSTSLLPSPPTNPRLVDWPACHLQTNRHLPNHSAAYPLLCTTRDPFILLPQQASNSPSKKQPSHCAALLS